MTTYRRNLALVVEGVGSSASSTGGIAWHYGKASIGTPGNYEWIGGSGSGEGLVGAPESVACSVDPWDCNLRGNGHTFELHATPQAKALFLRRPQRASDSLTTEIDEDDTTLAFDGAGDYTWSAADDGTVVWIGDEAIKLGSYAAGPQFTGCTRAMFSTTAQTQPAGMNIYRYNPKIVNRRCQLLVYDRDAGTTTQAWQGFVQKPTIDGPIIRIPAQDIWSAVSGAEVNRRVQKGMERFASGRPVPRNQLIRGGSVVMAGKFEPRVNKSAATAPHWVALQVGEGLFYANYSESTTPNSAALDDNGDNTSSARLGSILDSDVGNTLTGGEPIYEVLVVDRRQDEIGNTLPAYADFRSSTRDLDEPFHPVSISMALLTSGYGAYPQGVGAPQTAPGDTVTYVTKTQYFTAGSGPDLAVMVGKNVTSGAIIGRYLGTDTNPHYKLIPGDGGAATWTMESTNLYSTNGRPGGAYVDEAETYAYVMLDGSDGVTYGSASEPLLMRLDMTDGTQDWVSPATTTSGGTAVTANSCCAVDVDEANDYVIWELAAGGNEIKQFTASTGAEQAVSGSDISLQSGVATQCLTPDKDYIVVIGYGATPEIGRYTMPLSSTGTTFDGYSTGSLLLDGTDTTNDFGTSARHETGAQILPARDGSNKCWFCMGEAGNVDNRYIGRFDPAGGTYGSVDLEIDVIADSNLTPGTYNVVHSIAIDRFGYVYALVTDAPSAGNVDIVRYQPDGTFDLSFSAEGVTLPDPTGSDPNVKRITVDESDNVMLGDASGWVWFWSQT